MNKLLVTPSEVNEKSKEVTNLKEHMMSHLESRSRRGKFLMRSAGRSVQRVLTASSAVPAQAWAAVRLASAARV